MTSPSRKTPPPAATGDGAGTINHTPDGYHAGDPFQAEISIFKNAFAKEPDGALTVADIIAEITGPATEDHAIAVAKIRAEIEAFNNDAADTLKKNLPAFTLSGHVTEGERKNAMAEGRFIHSGWLQIDLDGKEFYPRTPEDVREVVGRDPHVAAAFLSPSGNGVKAIMRIPICATDAEHKTAFAAAEKHLRECYDLAPDAACKDSNRLCFVSHDLDAVIASGEVAELPVVLDEPTAPPTAALATPAAAARSAGTIPPNPGLTLSERFSRVWTLDDLAEMIRPIPRPEYSLWLALCSGAWNQFGEAATPVLAARWPEEQPGEYDEKFPHRTKEHTLGTVVFHAKEYGWQPARHTGTVTTATAADPPSPDVFREMLAERAFDVHTVPPPPVPVLKLDDMCIGTPGNLMALQAGIKAGKTAVVGAINAAFFIGDGDGEHDTLGFTAENPAGHAVLHIDTEQSRFDHDGTIRRALSRAGMEAPPPWFQSFSLADLPDLNRKMALETATEDAVETFGGVRAIVLDGVADFLRKPNDEEAAFVFVDELHRKAIELDCLIIAVIHENPGSDIGKTRGHLGSQLARKAETNLRLHKDTASGITTIWADYARHCHIPKASGTCFAWSDLMGRHVSKGTAGQIKAAAIDEKFRDEAERAFNGASSMKYSDLVTAIMNAVEIAEKTAQNRIKKYCADSIVIKNENGTYSLK